MATDGAVVEPQGQEETQETEETQAERIELTPDELDAKIQSEADRRVTQAIKKREADFKKELEQRTAEARKEAEELAKMSEAERRKAEKEREEMRLQAERDELQNERASFERERLQLQAERELANRSLPAQFAPYILGEDAESTFERITTLAEQWQEAVQGAVQERLKGKPPKEGESPKTRYTREQVESMTEAEVAADLDNVMESMQQWR